MGEDEWKKHGDVFSRIPLNFPATLIVDGTEVYDIHELTNLSIGGCLVPLEEEIVEGTKCTITIRLVGGLGQYACKCNWRSCAP